MRNRSVSTVSVVLFTFAMLFGGALQAQWGGSNNTNNAIYRNGSVGVGYTSAGPNLLSVKNGSTQDGVSVDGTNPAFILRNSSVFGYFGLVTAAGNFFTNTAVNDIVLQAQSGKIHIGKGTGTTAPTITIDGGNVGIGIQSPTIPFNVVSTNVDATANTQIVNETDLTVNPNAAQTTSAVRIAKVDYATVPAGSTNAVGEIRGAEGDAENYGSGFINMVRGHIGWAYNANASSNVGSIVGAAAYTESDSGTVSSMMNLHSWGAVYGGTVTTQYGIYSQVSNAGPNVMTNQYGIYDVVNGGTVTNRYELFLHTGAGAATNNWGIYQDTGTVRNFLASPLSIGSTAGAYTFNVFGAAAITTGPDQSAPRWITYDDGWNASYNTYSADTSTQYKSTGAFAWKNVPTGSTRMGATGTQTMLLDAVGNLAVYGQVISQTGGYRFPDGSVQTTAVTGGGGGSVQANNIGAGAFGACCSGGNFSFPAKLGIGMTAPGATLDVAGTGHFTNTVTLDTPNPGVSPHLLFTNEGAVADIKIDRTVLVNGTPYADFRFVNAAYTYTNMRLSDNGVLTVRSDIGSQTGNLQVAGTGNSFIWGSLGIGQIDQNAYPGRLAVQGPVGGMAFESTDASNSTFAISHQSSPIAGTVFARGTQNSNLLLGANETGMLMLNKNGNVGIGVTNPAATLDVNGTIHSAGGITSGGAITGSAVYATFQDVAEWVPASPDALEPGTVVVLDPEKGNSVVASSEAYDTTVAGVVSAHPGIILGKPGDGKAQVATTGRVKVRVDAGKGAIKIGDLLVTSDQAGTAMKSEPMVVNGRRFHQPGTIIGKALEPLASGTGEILVLLSLQ